MAQRAGVEVVHHQCSPAAAHQVGRALGGMVLGSHPGEANGTFSCLGPVVRAAYRAGMDALRPDDLPLVFRHHFNAGDVGGLMAHYYAPDATYAPLPGQVVSGADVEAAIGGLVALGHPIELTVRAVLVAGDTALLVVDHQIPGLGMSGTATDVGRRQPDGTWRCVIDNPHGGAGELHLPPATLQALGVR